MGQAEAIPEASWTGARQALEMGNSQMAAGLYPEAERSLQIANQLAPADTELKVEIEEALYLQLPGMVIRALLSRGEVEEARLVLRRAMDISAEHPEYLQMLTAMEADLNKGNLLDAGIPVVEVDGRAVLAAVNDVLRQHHALLGRYPGSLSEVNRILPPGKPPLEVFFISRYRTSGGGFQLQLVNRNNPEQVLSIDHTGLMQ